MEITTRRRLTALLVSAVRVNGSAVGYETGWVGCHQNVVRSWGAACSFPQGRQTPFRVEHL